MTRYLRRKGKEIILKLVECCQYCCKHGVLEKKFEEIFDIFNQTEKINIEDNYPSSEFLYNNLWGYLYDKDEDYEKCLEMLNKEIVSSFAGSGFSLKDAYIDPEYTGEVANVCYDYFAWLSSELGEKTFIEKEEAKNTLEKILEIFERS